MQVRIQKWGNSLALRIPKAFVVEARLKQGSLVEVRLVEGKLVVAPVVRRKLKLEKLLAGVTDQNLHSEVDTGPKTGNEAW